MKQFVLALLAILLGCTNDENIYDNPPKELFGTWKMVEYNSKEYGHSSNSYLNEYTITFYRDNSGEASTFANKYSFKYYIKNRILITDNWGGTKLEEINNPTSDIFIRIIINSNPHYKIEESQLCLYLSDTDFLIFHPQ